MNHPTSRILPTFVVALSALASAPAAATAQDAEAVTEYRQSLMQSFRVHMGGVRAALEHVAPMGHALHHATSFERMALALANAFPTNSAGSESGALPAIWEDRDAFMNRVTDIQTATARLAEVAESDDAAAIGEALGGVQQTGRRVSGRRSSERRPRS